MSALSLRNIGLLLALASCSSPEPLPRPSRAPSALGTPPGGRVALVEGGGVQPTLIGLDSAGNAYLAGSFRGTITFGSGLGPQTSSTQNDRLWVARVNVDGSQAWVRVLDARLDPEGLKSLTVSPTGELYLFGEFEGGISFNPSGGDVRRIAAACLYLTKLLPDGSYGWTRTLNSSVMVHAGTLALAPDGAIVYGGMFNGSMNLYPDDGSDTGTDMGLSAVDANGIYQQSGFLTRLEPDGSYGWSHVWSTPLGFGIARVAVDATGGITAEGGFWGTLDLDPTPGIDLQTNTQLRFDGSPAAATSLTRLSAAGGYQWTRYLVWPASPLTWAVASDGQLLVSGNFGLDCDFDTSPDSDLISGPPEGEEMFIARFDPDGTYRGTRRTVLVPSAVIPNTAVTATGGDLLFGGNFGGGVDFNFSDAAFNATVPGQDYLSATKSGFVSRVQPDGTYVGTFPLGSNVFNLTASAGTLGAIVTFESTADLSAWGGPTMSPAGSYALIWPG